MVDIKELMRTYVFINDPNVKEVTTKFGALVLGLGVATLGVWGTVTLAEGEGGADTQAAEAGTSDGLGGERTTDCVLEETADEWREKHADVILSNRLIDVEENGKHVCFTYTA